MAEPSERHFIEHAGHRLCVNGFDGDGSLEYVVLHGGPGGRSELGFGEALSGWHRTVMYDQFGGGMSDRLTDKDEIDLQYYLDEA
jgi:pimeloyl-ACP methyl ester carboxylesterase